MLFFFHCLLPCLLAHFSRERRRWSMCGNSQPTVSSVDLAAGLELTSIAPAAKAVEYHQVRFNATMGEGSPYVGASPEVDAAWDAISYDSKSR